MHVLEVCSESSGKTKYYKFVYLYVQPFYLCMVITYSRVWMNLGKVGNPARGQLTRENEYILLSPFSPENLVSRDGFGRPVPRQPAHSPRSG